MSSNVEHSPCFVQTLEGAQGEGAWITFCGWLTFIEECGEDDDTRFGECLGRMRCVRHVKLVNELAPPSNMAAGSLGLSLTYSHSCLVPLIMLVGAHTLDIISHTFDECKEG